MFLVFVLFSCSFLYSMTTVKIGQFECCLPGLNVHKFCAFIALLKHKIKYKLFMKNKPKDQVNFLLYLFFGGNKDKNSTNSFFHKGNTSKE